MKVTKNNVSVIYNEALIAAKNATDEYLRDHGAHPFNCGFAWVNIKPARGAMVAYMKANDIGRKAYDGGYDFWNPSGSYTQDMSAKAAGAGAFAGVLQKYGVNAELRSRLD